MAAQPLSHAEDIRAVRRAHERFLSSGEQPAGVRSLVADSWLRSAAAGVDADFASAPVVSGQDALRDYRDAHPLSHVFPLLYDVLGRAAQECDAVMAVGDEHGQLLWVCGTPAVLGQAERIHFAEGAVWDEAHAGTNAPGTALRLDSPVQILAAEHFARAVQPWTCTAAPIHDPATQAILGIVDVTGGADIASPQTLAMVRAAARMAEAELGRLRVLEPRPSMWLPSSASTVSALGRPDCLVELGGRTLRLSPRHSEILVILADDADGRSGDQLAVELYEEDVSASTMRAELARLRSLLGADLLDSRPYRLSSRLASDWVAVQRAIDAGDAVQAVRLYRGPILPSSQAPGVVERRDRLDRLMHAAVLSSDRPALMAAWTRSRWGADDRDVWERQVLLAPTGSPLHSIASAEVARLDRELGVG